ncbi:MAG: DNA repair protein RecO [Gammaproteobacteria bacterium]|nr:DNA repair protein RecO [Gammaproteobacteria bacterium]
MEIEQTAFVLHSRPYRETSVLVTFLSPDYGKFNAVVRGVRGGKKTSAQKAALLQPFQLLTVQWRERAHRPSDLVSLKQFELAGLRFPLSGESSLCGLYLNELLYRLLFPQVAVEALFEHYQQALYQLLSATSRNDQAWSLRQFEYQLLSELGQGLVCDQDLDGNLIETDVAYYFYPETGAIKAALDGLKTGIPISGECLQSLTNTECCEACLPALKRLFRAVLAPYLGSKPIMARALFSQGR